MSNNFSSCFLSKSVLCIAVEKNIIATGSLDRTIKIWNLEDGKLKQTLNGHFRGVWSLAFLTKYLLCSGSYDSTIKIWNLKMMQCSRTLFAHTGPVWSLCIKENLLVSASQDKTVRFLTILFEMLHFVVNIILG
jgi:WD40 repeat protein